jgi:hypothetical protein
MSSENKVFYHKLRKLLKETSSWPSKYIFKFIFSENDDQSEIIKEIFSKTSAEFIVKFSKNRKYISLSVSLIADALLMISYSGRQRLPNLRKLTRPIQS